VPGQGQHSSLQPRISPQAEGAAVEPAGAAGHSLARGGGETDVQRSSLIGIGVGALLLL